MGESKLIGEGEVLHKVCGSVQVARDLLRRSGAMYLDATSVPDHWVIESFARATRELALVVEALEGHLEGSLGPAA